MKNQTAKIEMLLGGELFAACTALFARFPEAQCVYSWNQVGNAYIPQMKVYAPLDDVRTLCVEQEADSYRVQLYGTDHTSMLYWGRSDGSEHFDEGCIGGMPEPGAPADLIPLIDAAVPFPFEFATYGLLDASGTVTALVDYHFEPYGLNELRFYVLQSDDATAKRLPFDTKTFWELYEAGQLVWVDEALIDHALVWQLNSVSTTYNLRFANPGCADLHPEFPRVAIYAYLPGFSKCPALEEPTLEQMLAHEIDGNAHNFTHHVNNTIVSRTTDYEDRCRLIEAINTSTSA